MTTKVGVVGASGRMGLETVAAVLADPELQLVCAISIDHAGERVPGSDELVFESGLSALGEANAEVAVDFTHIEPSLEVARYCATEGIHFVTGTSGYAEDHFERLNEQFVDSNAAVIPNFGIGAVLLKNFAAQAAPFFDTVEVIELHHNQKVDAPSGTAVDLAAAIAGASDEWDEDPTTKESIQGSRGAEGPGGVRIHAVRMKGMMGHQEVIFGTDGQTMTLRQDSLNRASFMPGVLLAIKSVSDSRHPRVVIGLAEYLGL